MSNTNTQPPAAGEAAHTPTPWHIAQTPWGDYIAEVTDSLYINPRDGVGLASPDADAAFIVRACNAYDINKRELAHNSAVIHELRKALARKSEIYAANQRTISELTEALERVIGEQYSLIKDEADDRATGIVGWNAMHQSLIDARAALTRAKEASK